MDRLGKQAIKTNCHTAHILHTCLTNQIEVEVKKGYSDVEIIEAVVRAVSPGLHLRDLLEVKQGLTLQRIVEDQPKGTF